MSGLADARERKRTEKREKAGEEIWQQIQSAFPDSIPGWARLPGFGHGSSYARFEMATPMEITFRRPDNSDYLHCMIEVFPTIYEPPSRRNFNVLLEEAGRLPLFVPDAAESWNYRVGLQVFAHSSWEWNEFLPKYERDPRFGKCYSMQIFVGRWGLSPTSATDFQDFVNHQLNRAADDKYRNEFAPIDALTRNQSGRVVRTRRTELRTKEQVRASMTTSDLQSRWRSPSTRLFLPLKSRAQDKANPVAIAIHLTARNEQSAHEFLDRIDWAKLQGLLEP